MAVFRIERTRDYTVMSNHHLRNANLSLKAKGLLSENPTMQGILIVRRERNVAQGTGALLSPNDWQLGATFTDKVVLTMYQVTGTKGWGGKKLWVPNIKLPHGMVYYDVNEPETSND